MTPEEQIDATVLAVMDQVGQDMVADGKAICSEPFPPASAPGAVPHSRSGELAGSFIYSVYQEGSQTILAVANTAPHAGFVNSGTSHMEARPFMPVLEEKWTPIVSSRITSAFGTGPINSGPAGAITPDFSSFAAS